MQPSEASQLEQATEDHERVSTSTDPNFNEFDQVRRTIKNDISTLQNMVQEIRKISDDGKYQSEELGKKLETLKEQMKIIEILFVHLQKILPMQADDSIKMKKGINDKDYARKSQLNDIKREIDEITKSAQALKQRFHEVERKQRPGSVEEPTKITPECFTASVEALKTQAGKCDVRMAEMDARFQVLETTSYNGSLVWRIKNYRNVRMMQTKIVGLPWIRNHFLRQGMDTRCVREFI